MARCWPLQMPHTAKAVLVSLADNANDEGVCWPSVALICERTCLSERAVQGAVAWLVKHGAVRRELRIGHSTTYVVTPSKYAQPVDNPRTRCTPAGDAPPQEMRGTPAGDAPPPPHHVHPPPAPRAPLTVIEPSVEPSRNRERSARGARIPADCPTTDDRQWARQNFPAIDVAAVAAEFRDYWAAVPGHRGVKLDWSGTWRNWLRREARHARPAARASPAPSRYASTIAQLTGRTQEDPNVIDTVARVVG